MVKKVVSVQGGDFPSFHLLSLNFEKNDFTKIGKGEKMVVALDLLVRVFSGGSDRVAHTVWCGPGLRNPGDRSVRGTRFERREAGCCAMFVAEAAGGSIVFSERRLEVGRSARPIWSEPGKMNR